MSEVKPVDLLLYCPNCFEQHVDEAKPDICELCGEDFQMHDQDQDSTGAFSTCRKQVDGRYPIFEAWLNPPHKSHRCNFCNHVWRPADVPTNGVLKLQSKGERDGSPRPIAFANGKDFNAAVETVTKGTPADVGSAESSLA